MDDKPEKSYGTVTATQVVLIGDGVEETPLGKEIKQLGEKVKLEHDLTQLLGVSLRGVLPYAQQELEELIEDQKDSSDQDLKDELDICNVHIQRAQQALQHLNDSPLSIAVVLDDAFDDTFEIRFEDSE